MKKVILGLVLTMSLSQVAWSQTTFSQRIQEAMASDIRTEEEKARDNNRKPVETLAFFQVDQDSKVLELVPGGGWYTKLLAPALKDTGELHVAIGTRRVEERLKPMDEFSHVVVHKEGIEISRPEGARFATIKPFSLPATDFDVALTFRNLHNFTAEGRKSMNDAVFAALKPGGLYGVVDHTRRHMEPTDSDNRRRMDPVLAIHEIQESGFEFVGFSNIHAKSNDGLSLEVGDAAVTGQTDRFTLLFRKPE